MRIDLKHFEYYCLKDLLIYIIQCVENFISKNFKPRKYNKIVINIILYKTKSKWKLIF